MTAPAMTSDAGTRLLQRLRPLAHRIRLHDGQRLVVHTLWLPLLATVLALFAGRLFPIARYDTWAWLPPIVWLMGVLGYSLLHPLPAIRVAQRTDVALGLRDRLATALELNRDLPDRRLRFNKQLVARQRADALAVADTVEPARAFPLRWPWRPLAAAAGCLVAAALLTYLPNPMDAILAERAAIAAEAEAQAEEVDAIAAELAENEMLDPEAREELLRRLREAAEALRANPGDREEALADLAELEDQLRRRLDPQNAARQAALDGLAADLSALAGQTDSDPTLDEAARLLEELAAQASEMSPSQRSALAQTLSDAGARLAGTDPDLAGTLSQLAQKVRSGEVTASDAQSAAEGLNQAAADGALQEALAEALNQARESSDALAGAGQPGNRGQASGESSQGESQNGGQGEEGGVGEGNGGGEGEGQGQGQGQGTSGGGGGTTAPSGSPSTRQGRAGRPSDPNQAYEISDEETIVAPWQQGEPGDPDFLPGRQTGQGEETVRENQQPQPGAPGAAAVPYADVYPSYAAAAAEAIERDYVPTGLRDYVREYFSRLEP
jgi:hypothetical protein